MVWKFEYLVWRVELLDPALMQRWLLFRFLRIHDPSSSCYNFYLSGPWCFQSFLSLFYFEIPLSSFQNVAFSLADPHRKRHSRAPCHYQINLFVSSSLSENFHAFLLMWFANLSQIDWLWRFGLFDVSTRSERHVSQIFWHVGGPRLYSYSLRVYGTMLPRSGKLSRGTVLEPTARERYKRRERLF